jgi:anaerobic selenocysteine-containing dehydrogenase
VRALVTVAGNPILSTPNAAQLDAALASLDFMVSVDIYLNETTRHADVILPPPGPLQRPHYDTALYQLAVRNVGNYSPATLPLDEGALEEWEILAKLALIVQGAGADADPSVVEDVIVDAMLAKRSDGEVLRDATAGRRGPERILDLQLRMGPYPDMSLDVLEANPHGVDKGPLVPRLPGVLRTPSGRVELAPAELLADVERLLSSHERLAQHDALVLIGRRDLRSNNSWMHNLEVLVKGKPRCTMHVHPADAARLGLAERATVRSAVGELDVDVELTEDIMPGVVSLPHGWGHQGSAQRVAAAHPGVNANTLTDDSVIDALSGNAVFNGVPVTVAPA